GASGGRRGGSRPPRRDDGLSGRRRGRRLAVAREPLPLRQRPAKRAPLPPCRCHLVEQPTHRGGRIHLNRLGRREDTSILAEWRLMLAHGNDASAAARRWLTDKRRVLGAEIGRHTVLRPDHPAVGPAGLL